jgi:RimJ/RimL family protein N-acetyltransferase
MFATRQPFIYTRRTLIRPLEVEDLATFHALMEVKDVWQAFHRDAAPTEAESNALLAAMRAGQSPLPPPSFRKAFGVVAGSSPGLIGIVDLVGAQELADLTIALAPEARGTKLSKEVLSAVFDWCCKETPIRTIVGNALETNAASIAMMSSLGMTPIDAAEAIGRDGRSVAVRAFEWRANAQ